MKKKLEHLFFEARRQASESMKKLRSHQARNSATRATLL